MDDTHTPGRTKKWHEKSKYCFTTIIQHQYKRFTTLLQLKSGDQVATNTDALLDKIMLKIINIIMFG